EPSVRSVAAHTRRVAVKPTTEEAGDSGLKFDSTVPLEVIEIDDPRTAELTAEQYEIIGEKATYRLAQRPGSYVVLKYVRRVIKVKETGVVSCPPAPAGVFDRCHADVSFLVGLCSTSSAHICRSTVSISGSSTRASTSAA